jgi:hypothetical protein
MRIDRLAGSNVETYAVKDDHDMLCGLIHLQDDKRWKIELMRKFTHFEPTREQAFAWVRGAHAVITEVEHQAAVALATRRKRSQDLMRRAFAKLG